MYAWTDSTIVLSWLCSNPRRFKTYVGNRVSYIVELISPERWSHVESANNPADCASRGMYITELLDHELWWKGPSWLHQDSSHWPQQLVSSPPESTDEERQLSLLSVSNVISCPLNVSDYSLFARLKRVTAWIFRFTKNCLSRKQGMQRVHHTFLNTSELHFAEQCLCSAAQRDHFVEEIESLKRRVHAWRTPQLATLCRFCWSASSTTTR